MKERELVADKMVAAAAERERVAAAKRAAAKNKEGELQMQNELWIQREKQRLRKGVESAKAAAKLEGEKMTQEQVDALNQALIASQEQVMGLSQQLDQLRADATATAHGTTAQL